MTKDIKQFVSFHNGDPGKIASFVSIIQLSHVAIEKFIIAKGIDWQEWFSCKELAAPIKALNVEFHSPVYPGKEYVFRVNVLNVGDSSVNLEITVLDGDEKAYAKLKFTIVFVNVTNVEKLRVPEDIRLKLLSDT